MKRLSVIRLLGSVIAIAAVLFFANAYRLEALGKIQTDVMVITDRNLARSLQSGKESETEDDGSIGLESFSAAQTIYRRGDNYYVGEDKTRIDSNYPFYALDGTALWYFNENGVLITDDFMSFEPYQGLYVSDGRAYEADGVASTDEETYLFAGLSNGLFINTVPFTVEQEGGLKQDVRLNSLVKFDTDQVRFYVYENGKLIYDETAFSLATASVVINGERYAYAEFLRLLGVSGDSTSAKRQEENEEETEADAGSSENEKSGEAGGDGLLAGDAQALTAGGNTAGASAGQTGDEESASADAGIADGAGVIEGSGLTAEGLSDTAEGSGLDAASLENEKDGEADAGLDSEQTDGEIEGLSSANGEIGSDGTGSGGSGDSSSGSGSGSGSGSSGDGSSGSGSGSGGSGDSGSGSSGSGGGGDSGNGGSGSTGGSGSSSGSGSGTGTSSVVTASGASTGGDASSSVSGSSDADYTDGEADDTGDDDASGNGDADSGDDESGEGGDSGDTTGVVGEVECPTVSIGAVTAGVYSLDTTLSISDPDNRLKRVIFRVYEDNDGEKGELITRKNFKKEGDISVVYVYPDTTVWLEVSFVWLDGGGDKQTVVCEEGILLTTLPIEGNVDAITVVNSEAQTYAARSISIPGLTLSSTNSSGVQDNASLSYISSIEVAMEWGSTKTNMTDSYDAAVSSSDLRTLKNGRTTTWTSESIFDPGCYYNWTMTFFDRFGNELPTSPDPVTGSTRTSLRAPTASVAMTKNEVGAQTISISINNQDNVTLSNCYVMVYNTTTDSPVPIFTDANGASTSSLPISSSGEVIVLNDLPSGNTFRVRVYGTYNIYDTAAETETVGALLGQTTIYTSSISNLGTVYFTITNQELTADSGAFRLALSGASDKLKPLLCRVGVSLSAAENGDTAFTLTQKALDTAISGLEKSSDGYYILPYTVGNISIDTSEDNDGEAGGSAADAYGPEVVLRYADSEADTLTAWDALLAGCTVEVRYPEGKFAACTTYRLSLTVTASQGGERYSVGASSNYLSFTTLKQAPEITYSSLLVTSNFAEFYDFCIEDPNEAIPNGIVYMRLYSGSRLISSSIVYTNTTYTEDDEDYPAITYTGLSTGTTYRVAFYVDEYNVGYTSDTAVANYTLATQISFTTGEGLVGNIELRALNVSEADSTKFDVTYRVTVEDNGNALSDKVYTIVRYRALGIDASIDDDYVEKIEETYSIGETYDEYILTIEPYCSYRYEVWVSTSGHTLELDEITFETDEPMYTIASEADFDKYMSTKDDAYLTYQDKKFIVLNDIEMTKAGYYYGVTNKFEGTLDFQGYKLTRTTSSALISYMGSRGVIKNVEMDINLTRTGYSYTQGLV